ncbi:hypothetical protein CA946_00985 [Fischerella thermalis 111/344/542]|nr:hypothetical protein CA946_00985 [Fischerella thermalis 111/344/542]
MQKNVKHQQQKFPIMRLFKRKSLWMPTTVEWRVCRPLAASGKWGVGEPARSCWFPTKSDGRGVWGV